MNHSSLGCAAACLESVRSASARTFHLVDALYVTTTITQATEAVLFSLSCYRAHLKALLRSAEPFSVAPHPDEALRLSESQAEAVGQDLVEVTGVRVHLRPFNATH